MNTNNMANVIDTDDHESISDNNTNNSIMAQDSIVIPQVASSSLQQALTTYGTNTVLDTASQSTTENLNLLNTLSRVTIMIGKYPNDATLHNYSDLQMWMYMHTNKRAPVDICQSLNRMFLLQKDYYDQHTLFNLCLICAEVYQTVGNMEQACCQYNQAEVIAKSLDDTRRIKSLSDVMEKDRKRKKLEDIGMKLEFQSEFQFNLIRSRKQQRFNQTNDDFLKQLNIDNPSAEECRCIWRKIVLQVVLNPNISITCAQWLLSYASYHQRTTLSHANILYVALNLFLLGYGSTIFRNRLDIEVFKILDDIGRYFEENGSQSKQFSPVHKMAHVWGTAAVAFYLASDEHKYLVCASMMRVSFESLSICFLSSGIESLYILAHTHAPDFLNMMAVDPGVKLISPDCVNYFRRKLENNTNCIRYSAETVDRFVSEVFNIDQTANRI